MYFIVDFFEDISQTSDVASSVEGIITNRHFNYILSSVMSCQGCNGYLILVASSVHYHSTHPRVCVCSPV